MSRRRAGHRRAGTGQASWCLFPPPTSPCGCLPHLLLGGAVSPSFFGKVLLSAFPFLNGIAPSVPSCFSFSQGVCCSAASAFGLSFRFVCSPFCLSCFRSFFVSSCFHFFSSGVYSSFFCLFILHFPCLYFSFFFVHFFLLILFFMFHFIFTFHIFRIRRWDEGGSTRDACARKVALSGHRNPRGEAKESQPQHPKEEEGRARKKAPSLPPPSHPHPNPGRRPRPPRRKMNPNAHSPGRRSSLTFGRGGRGRGLLFCRFAAFWGAFGSAFRLAFFLPLVGFALPQQRIPSSVPKKEEDERETSSTTQRRKETFLLGVAVAFQVGDDIGLPIALLGWG